MSAAKSNGFPAELQEPPPMPDVPRPATERQLSQWLFTVLMAWDPVWRAMLGFLEVLHGMVVRAREDASDTRIEVREVKVVAEAIAEKLGVKLTAAAKLPPMRDPDISAMGLEAMVPKLAHAALEGERRPDSTPNAEIRRVLSEEIKKREEAAKFAKLQAEEDEREAKRKKAAEDRAASFRSIRNAVVGGLCLAGAIEAVHWLATLHH